MELSNIISIISVLISVSFTIFTLIRDRKRNKIVDSLNELLLSKEINEVSESKKADFSCELYQNGGSGSYCIQITNTGKSPAYNLNVKILNGDWDLMLDSFPYRIVHPNQEININTAVFISCQEKEEIQLMWQNEENGSTIEKEYIFGL